MDELAKIVREAVAQNRLKLVNKDLQARLLPLDEAIDELASITEAIYNKEHYRIS